MTDDVRKILEEARDVIADRTGPATYADLLARIDAALKAPRWVYDEAEDLWRHRFESGRYAEVFQTSAGDWWANVFHREGGEGTAFDYGSRATLEAAKAFAELAAETSR